MLDIGKLPKAGFRILRLRLGHRIGRVKWHPPAIEGRECITAADQDRAQIQLRTSDDRETDDVSQVGATSDGSATRLDILDESGEHSERNVSAVKLAPGAIGELSSCRQDWTP